LTARNNFPSRAVPNFFQRRHFFAIISFRVTASRRPAGRIFAVLRTRNLGSSLRAKSPIISPDLEKGRGSLDFPLTVRDAPDEIPLSAQASKPSLSPESRDSPRNPARQQMTSPDPGGLSDSTSRRKSGQSGQAGESKLGFASLECWNRDRVSPVEK